MNYNPIIPLTKICRNDCGYCAFKQSPDDPDAIILLEKEEVLATLKEAEKYGCKEALFTMGEDADTEEAVKAKLDKLGFKNMCEYIYDICKMTVEETDLLPHTNAGNFSYEDMKMLKEYNISMGMMLESSSERLMNTIAHEKSPGKNPKIRLETIENAGKLNIAYTTGILIGIGETKEEIGKCAAIFSQETIYAGGDILIFRPSVYLNPIFMGTLLNTADVCRQRAEKGQGDAVVHIHTDSLGSIKIRIPENSEQDAIADILFEMDKEIKLLEQKLEKYRQVKRGMMQQLLTGKIRLV